MNKSRVSSTYTVITAVIAWFALALQLYLLISRTPGNGMTPLLAVGRFLIFFTILSNLLVAVSLTIVLVKPGSSAGLFFARPSSIAAVTCYIFIVGLVYNIVLRSIWQPRGLQQLADELLHVGVPVLFVLYWLLFASKRSLHWKHAFQWLLFPAAYFAYALARGALEGFYAYPFINVPELGYGRVGANAAGLLIIFLATGPGIVATGKKMSRGEQ